MEDDFLPPLLHDDDDDDFPTPTSALQEETMLQVAQAIDSSSFDPDEFRKRTVQYLMYALDNNLDANFASLDASRPWLVYWVTHALVLLGMELDTDTCERCVETLRRFQNLHGGFGGGPQQLSHLAPTFASIMALCTIGTPQAWRCINRKALYSWLLSCKLPNGGFSVHHNGECDSRAMYCALAIASLTNILTFELLAGCVEWLRHVQGFDGGVGAEQGTESHGGYAYCCLASLIILGETRNVLDIDSFVRWLTQRQMAFEGGFQGRTQKLVDSCYSFWVGACFPLLDMVRFEQSIPCGGNKPVLAEFPSPDFEALQRYVLEACTHGKGGVQDKPGSGRDYYHTCYSLSGLSVLSDLARFPPTLTLARTDALYNVEQNRLGRARAFFAKLPNTHEELIG